MARTVQGFAARSATLPAALVEATPRAVRAGGTVLEEASRANLLAASGGDMRLSRVRSGKGANLTLDLAVRGAGRGATAVVTPGGPIMLVERDTKRHKIGPRQYGAGRRYAMAGETMASGGTARRRKAQRAGYVYVPGLGSFRSVQHPGTRGKYPIRNAFRSHSGQAGRAGALVFATATRNHLGT